jgi:hypothetical protein
MKALSTLFSLVAIIALVILSANLFLKEQYFLSSSLIIVWIGSTILWVKFAASVFNGFAFFGKSSQA